MRHLFTLIFCLLTFLSQPAFAAPVHPSVLSAMHARGDTCAYACPAAIGSVWANASAPARHPALGKFGSPNQTDTARGTARIAALVVQFAQDSASTTTGSGRFSIDKHGTDTAVGDSIELMLNRADTFYRAVSYGLLKLSYTVFDSKTVNLANTMDYYSASSTRLKEMVQEAVRQVDTFVSFDTYDVLVVFHAGTAYQLTGTSKDIPSQFFNDISSLVDTATTTPITHAIIMAPFGQVQSSGETVTMLGTFCHEFGHALGLPDLYSTGSGSGGIGDWGLMGTGNYNGRPQGDSPSWMDAWCREYLGWADTKTLDTGQSISSFQRAEADSTIYKIKTQGSLDTEYFLLEVREPRNTGVDSAPGSGLLIWHIDNTMGSLANNTVNNLSVVAHRRVDLEEADGSDVGSSSSTFSGDGNDPWPGGASKTDFGDNSTPGSRSYYYTDSTARFALKSISQSNSIAFTADFTSVTVASTDVIIYPSSCVIGRTLAPWPRLGAFARDVRDAILETAPGRRTLAAFFHR